MSDNHSAQRLELVCTAVPWLRALYLSVSLLSFCCIALLPLPLTVVFLLLTVTAGVAWRCWRQRCELGGMGGTVIWDPEGLWWWLQGGEETALFLSGDTYHSTGMVILNFYHPDTGRRHSLVLFPASVGSACFRRLSVRLSLEGGQSVRSGFENSQG